MEEIYSRPPSATFYSEFWANHRANPYLVNLAQELHFQMLKTKKNLNLRESEDEEGVEQ